jgi:tungstate transport system ATP-binding protein
MHDVAVALEPAAARRSLLPLEVRGLRYEVFGKALVDGIDLSLGKSGITTVMGPNGAGKSLLLRLLHGLLTPTSGTIRWNAAPLDESVRKRQALIFQRPVLLRRSVFANVEFVLRLRSRENGPTAYELLEHVGLQDRAEQPARRLSGGEQQRLAMARALALEPDILFMDEPTASLDPTSVASIESIVAGARREGTRIILVTHDPGQAHRLADEVVFLHRGRLMEHTPARQFFDRPCSREAQDYLAGRLVI